MGSYSVVGSGDLVREQDRGVQGEGCWGNNLHTDGHPLDGFSGARECREGEEKDESDADDEDTRTRRFLMEKHCSAWEKWAGRGGATLAVVVSTATDIVSHFFSAPQWGRASCNDKNHSTFKMYNVKKTVEIKNRIEWNAFYRYNTAQHNTTYIVSACLSLQWLWPWGRDCN